jgi:hypothetical protein
MRTVLFAAVLCASGACLAQNAASWTSLDAYANFETAGATATIAGDADRDATIALEMRRVGDPAFRTAHPLVRVDATHLVGSLFALAPNTAYEIRATLTDPDGVTGNAVRTLTATTRIDTLVEPSLRTLYVSPAGSDGANGLTPGTAVQTIQRAADLAQAGDVVRVAPGVYRESVTVPRSGTASQPIVFRGDGNGVVLDGSAALPADTAWTALANGVWRTTLAFDTGHVVGEQGRLYRYGSLAALAALAAGAPGGYWFDGATRQLHVKFFDNQAPAAHTIYAARFENGFVVDGRAFVRIENFEIRYFGAGDYGKAVYLRYASDAIVRGNRIRDIGAAGVWVKGGDRHRIEDNAFTDTSIAGWPWDSTKGSSAENSAVVFTDDVGRGHVIRRNTTDGGFNGIAPCGGSAPPGAFTTEVDVYRNDLRRHNDDAFEPEGWCANVRIFDNTIRDSHMAFAVAPAAPGPTWIVRNVAWNTGNTRTSQTDGYTASALKINSGYPEAVGPLLIYHNTLVTTAPATDALNLLNPGNATLLRTRNNIVAGTRYVVAKVNPIATDMNYDLLYTTDPTRFARWMNVSYANLAALQALPGLETNGVQAPPQLVAPAAGDFRLAAGSAAIDRGAVLPGINDGYAGAAPDLGAFEFGDTIFANGFESTAQ